VLRDRFPRSRSTGIPVDSARAPPGGRRRRSGRGGQRGAQTGEGQLYHRRDQVRIHRAGAEEQAVVQRAVEQLDDGFENEELERHRRELTAHCRRLLSSMADTLFYQRPSVAYVPIDEAPPFVWRFVWLTATETSLARAFDRTAAEIAKAVA
jgi:hypothetical protein